MKGSLGIADKSWGIVSAPGYQDYLASQISKVVLEILQKEMEKM